MSRHGRLVHIGPYAEWHLGKEERLPEELCADLEGNEKGVGLTFPRYPPTVAVVGGRFVQMLFVPFYHPHAQESPPRRFCWDENTEGGAADLTGVDRQQEIEWFRGTFDPLLDALAAHYGKPPQIRWGIVSVDTF